MADALLKIFSNQKQKKIISGIHKKYISSICFMQPVSFTSEKWNCQEHLQIIQIVVPKYVHEIW